MEFGFLSGWSLDPGCLPQTHASSDGFDFAQVKSSEKLQKEMEKEIPFFSISQHPHR